MFLSRTKHYFKYIKIVRFFQVQTAFVAHFRLHFAFCYAIFIIRKSFLYGGYHET